MKFLGAVAVSIPTGFQPFFGQHGQAFAKGIQHVDGSGVMVDAAFAIEAVPVLAQPVDVETKGRWG